MMNDDGVGLLTTATSSPGGDYTDLGAFHQNTIMSFSTSSPDTSGGSSSVVATHNLYIRTQNSSFDEATPRASETSKFMLWNSSNNILQQVDIASNDYTNIITNVLLPIWKRSSNFDGTSGDYGFPRYKFETSFSNFSNSIPIKALSFKTYLFSKLNSLRRLWSNNGGSNFSKFW